MGVQYQFDGTHGGYSMKAKLALAVAAIAMAALPVVAHHSFAAEFDGNKKVTLKGNVTKVDWMNPHIWLYLDVKDDKGVAAKWQCEGGPPNTLTRNGWTKSAIKLGDEITIEGTLARDGSKTCNATRVSLPDGKRVFAGSSNPDAQKE
jgi:hypothetical protein